VLQVALGSVSVKVTPDARASYLSGRFQRDGPAIGVWSAFLPQPTANCTVTLAGRRAGPPDAVVRALTAWQRAGRSPAHRSSTANSSNAQRINKQSSAHLDCGMTKVDP